jgi:hypothetical protein
LRVEKSASEIQVGDKVHFPNSRRAVPVEQILSEGENTITLISEKSRWMMIPDFKVAVELPDD